MPRCANEVDSGLGLGWVPPDPLLVRIETPRLVVRSYEIEDSAALYEAISSCRDHLLPWMAWAKDGHKDVAETTHYISSQIVAARQLASFHALGIGIFDKATGRVLGGTGIHGVHRDTASAEVGYWVRRDATRAGICTEATAHVLSWALGPRDTGGLQLQRIIIYCSAANTASRRVPEKLGLRQEVLQRRDFHVPGFGCTDRLGWGVLAEEWDCDRSCMRRAE